MTSYAFDAFLLNCIYLVLALAVMFGAIRLFNYLSKVSFSEAFDRIEESPMALAVYFGARILAMAIIVSAFLA